MSRTTSQTTQSEMRASQCTKCGCNMTRITTAMVYRCLKCEPLVSSDITQGYTCPCGTFNRFAPWLQVPTIGMSQCNACGRNNNI